MTTADEYYLKGVQLHSDGNFELAIDYFTEAIKLNPNDADYYYIRAICFDKMDKLEKAVEDYSKAITIKPCDECYYSPRANCYKKMGEFQKAIEDYSNAIELKPARAKIYSNRADCYKELEEYENAIEDYSKAIALEPNHTENYTLRDDCYKKLEDDNEDTTETEPVKLPASWEPNPPETCKIEEQQFGATSITKISTTAEYIRIEEGQTGITYEDLFAPYLKGATKITITDAYIRNFFQALNLMEFIEVMDRYRSETDDVKVELITKKDEENNSRQLENLAIVGESCSKMGIKFSFSYDSDIHDRSIEIDTGWYIIPGRGLDIYKKCERKDAFHSTTRNQKYRACKKFGAVYLKLK